jgi:hypothetical protein
MIKLVISLWIGGVMIWNYIVSTIDDILSGTFFIPDSVLYFGSIIIEVIRRLM